MKILKGNNKLHILLTVIYFSVSNPPVVDYLPPKDILAGI